MNNIELCRVKLQNTSLKVYSPAPTLLFALSDDKVIVITYYHTFFLRHTHRNYIPRLNRIRYMIEHNKIKTETDLINEMELNIGEGVEMIMTRIERHIEVSK